MSIQYGSQSCQNIGADMHSRKPWPPDKNPLHPSALRFKDVHPGAEFLVFNIYDGVTKRGRFVTKIAVRNGRYRVTAQLSDGKREFCYLEDMGIVSRPNGFSTSYFTVRANREHLLPPVIQRPSSNPFAGKCAHTKPQPHRCGFNDHY